MMATVLLSVLTLSVMHGAAAGESWLPKDFTLSNVVPPFMPMGPEPKLPIAGRGR
jgi:hypothetical protein